MSPIFRALLGAALGALATLCFHPASRPFMVGVLSRASPEALKRCIDSNTATLSEPTSLSDASLWMQMAAARIAHRDRLSAKEKQTLLGIAEAARAKDRTNAFWPQMEALIYLEFDQPGPAIAAWKEASTCVTWDDYQTKRLLRDRQLISDLTGVNEAWQLAYVYYSRSEDVSNELRYVARMLLTKADYDTASGLTLRFATLENGDLLRKHSHSSQSSINGMDIVNLATYPSDSLQASGGINPSPKKLWAGEDKVVTNLTKILGHPEWSIQARKIFADNESWRALTVHDSNESQSQLLALGTVMSSSIASAVVVVSIVGFLIWLTGKLVAWRLARNQQIKPVTAIVIALSLGTLVEFLTWDFSAAFAAALCGGFLTVAPDRSRKVRPNDLGPLFTLMSAGLGIICSSLLLIYLIGITTAANAVLPSLGVPSEYFDKPLLAGLSAVSFGLVFLFSPIWAVVHRLGTPYVLSLSLTKLGAFISLSGLCLSILLGPLAVYADHRFEKTFTELVQNEPVHYYIQR